MMTKLLPYTFFAITGVFFVPPGRAASSPAAPAPAHESIEWCDIWIANADKDDRPRVLLIGDSITRAYYKTVEKELEGKAYVTRLSTSRCVGDPVLLKEIALVLSQMPFAVIHFNNGMHGWGNSDDFYKTHFPEFLSTIRQYAPKAKLIWATTTPVRDASALDKLDPRTDRVKVRNAIAASFVEPLHIPIDDLFGLVLNHPEYYKAGGIHFNEQGQAIEGKQVAAAIARQL